MHDQAVLRFITAALAGAANEDPFDLGMVSEGNARLVYDLTRVDIAGFTRTLSTDEVRHIFKSHGDTVREQARNQLAIRKSDLADCVAIIDIATSVVVKGEIRGKKPRRLIYQSPVDGHVVECVETLHPARRVVAVKTMRKW